MFILDDFMYIFFPTLFRSSYPLKKKKLSDELEQSQILRINDMYIVKQFY